MWIGKVNFIFYFYFFSYRKIKPLNSQIGTYGKIKKNNFKKYLKINFNLCEKILVKNHMLKNAYEKNYLNKILL